MALARSEFVHLMSEAAGLQKGLVSSAGAKVGIGSHELNESVRGLLRWLGEEPEGKALRSRGGRDLGGGLLGSDFI